VLVGFVCLVFCEKRREAEKARADVRLKPLDKNGDASVLWAMKFVLHDSLKSEWPYLLKKFLFSAS